jgi:hypothetical protein
MVNLHNFYAVRAISTKMHITLALAGHFSHDAAET